MALARLTHVLRTASKAIQHLEFLKIWEIDLNHEPSSISFKVHFPPFFFFHFLHTKLTLVELVTFGPFESFFISRAFGAYLLPSSPLFIACTLIGLRFLLCLVCQFMNREHVMNE